MNTRAVIVFVYNSSQDPLFKGNLLLFLQQVGPLQPDLRLHLITFEQKEYRLDSDAQEAQRLAWASDNIIWHPLQWHSGSFKLLKKAYDLLLGFLLCLRLRLSGARSIVGLGTVAGSFSFMIAKALGLKYYGYQFEPHSEFMLDCHVWPANSMAYKGLHFMEALTSRYAEILSTGTQHMVKRLASEGSPAKVYLLPSCVDETRFQFSAVGRARVRARYSLSAEQSVVLYLGKFGGIYYDQETADLCAALLQKLPELHFLIATPDLPTYVASLMRQAGVPENRVTITRSTFEEVPDYISAADFGLVAVPPTPAQQFRSPIKVGEYLCCGLPYLVCRGVSEDDLVAVRSNVGIVVDAFTPAETARIAPQLAAFLAEPKDVLRARCRAAGIDYRSFKQFVPVVDEIFKQL
jgi:hypothetical protein